ncbi:MAG: DUF4124 domain-containing protein [Nitrosomonadales bacterium]|nr:DUF4124 domain-containing protein [Nitrosomonadales bacterium]
MKRCLPVCLLLLSFSAHGALTKWVDAEGKVHYSDEPPPANVKAKTLIAPSAASGVPAEKTYIERETDLKKSLKAREETEQKAAQQQEAALAKQKYCSSLRANLTTMEKSPRIASYNEKGERVLMDETARQQQLAEIRQRIAAECN